MGAKLSNAQETHKNDLMCLLKSAAYSKQLAPLVEKLLLYIDLLCPFFPANGTLDIKVWDEVGAVLHKHISASVQILRVWQICRNSIAELANPLLAPPPDFSAGPMLLPPAETPEIFLNGCKQPAAAAVSLETDVKPILPTCTVASSPKRAEQFATKNLVAEVLKNGNSEEITDNVPTKFSDLHRLWRPPQISKCQVTAEPKCEAALPSAELTSLIPELGEEMVNQASVSLRPLELASLSFNYVPEQTVVIFPPLSINSELFENVSESCITVGKSQELSVVKKLPLSIQAQKHVSLLSNKEQSLSPPAQLKDVSVLKPHQEPNSWSLEALSPFKSSKFVDCVEGGVLISTLLPKLPSSVSIANFASSKKTAMPQDLISKDCESQSNGTSPFQTSESLKAIPNKQPRLIVLNGLASQVFDPGKRDSICISLPQGNDKRFLFEITKASKTEFKWL